MNEVRSRIKPEIGQEQCNTEMLSERVIQIKKYVYLYFIDYAIALDTLQHKDLFELLGNLNLKTNHLHRFFFKKKEISKRSIKK